MLKVLHVIMIRYRYSVFTALSMLMDDSVYCLVIILTQSCEIHLRGYD